MLERMSEEARGSLQAPPAPPAPATPASTANTESDEPDDLMLRWEDHHKSFFELAEDLCHQEQFIDVTISCGDQNFPAHKLILSVCSPYFKNLFLRNPCKHPIVVLKDVHYKYMKLLLIFMYRGEVAVPQEDLAGLLKVARSLQVRGLAEMTSPAVVQSPRKRYLSEMMADSDLESAADGEFSIEEVKSKLCGQLEIQAVPAASPSSAGTPPLAWPAARHLQHSSTSTSSHPDCDATSGPRSSRSESGGPSEEEPRARRGSVSPAVTPCKRELGDWGEGESSQLGRKERERHGDSDLLLQDYHALLKKERVETGGGLKVLPDYELLAPEERPARPASSLIDAARAAGLDIPPASSSPATAMSSISALLAAAQATGGIPGPATTSPGPDQPTKTSQSSGPAPAGPSQQGLDLSNPHAAMANVNVSPV